MQAFLRSSMWVKIKCIFQARLALRSLILIISSNTMIHKHHLFPQLHHNPFVYRSTHFVSVTETKAWKCSMYLDWMLTDRGLRNHIWVHRLPVTKYSGRNLIGDFTASQNDQQSVCLLHICHSSQTHVHRKGKQMSTCSQCSALFTQAA